MNIAVINRDDMNYYIRSTVEVDSEDGYPLYWSNDDGWVDKDSATVFTANEKDSIPYIPANSEWVM